MAFQMSGFQPAAGGARGGGLPGVHTYRTQDAAATVAAANYFNPIATVLSPGDLIYRVTVDANGAVTSTGFHVVRTVSVTSVTVSPALNIPLV